MKLSSNSELPAPKKRTLPGAVWVLGLVSMLMDISSEMIHSVLPAFMLTVLGMSTTSIGAIDGLAEATALIVKLFSGTLSDALGKRKGLTLLGYGLAALTKPLFALATGAWWILGARIADRIGKGIRGAPRDALIADITPKDQHGAAFGLRQALDTVGAFVGPILAIALMTLVGFSVRGVFAVAIIPALLTLLLLLFGIQESKGLAPKKWASPFSLQLFRQLPEPVYQVVIAGGLLTLARLSEAFLVLRAQQLGVSMAWLPGVFIVMNLVYALAAYPLGILADRLDRLTLLKLSVPPLLLAHLLLAHAQGLPELGLGLIFWGLHMAATQGLLSAMLASAAPATLRGTAFGVFNLASGLVLLAGGTLAGFLWETFGSSATFVTSAGFTVLAGLSLFLLKPTIAAPKASD